MNREDIIRMAREVGLPPCAYDDYGNQIGNLESFAALVAAAEREACAKVCDQAVKENEETNAEFSATEIFEKAVVAGAIHQAQRIASAIRARGQS